MACFLQILNPPLLAIAAGVLVGISPLGAPLFSPPHIAKAIAAKLPLELALCIGMLHFEGEKWIEFPASRLPKAWNDNQVIAGVIKQATEMLTLLAGGSIALQTVVLAASLFQKIPEAEESLPQADNILALPDGQGSLASNWTRPGAARPTQPAEAVTQQKQEWERWKTGGKLDSAPQKKRSASQPSQRPQQIMSLLLPKTLVEWKMIAAIAAVRFVIVPAATLQLVTRFVEWGFLPADPVCWLVLLLQV